ncbi:MAG: MipA/OmpV family protein [Geminicoccaceae bacterium]
MTRFKIQRSTIGNCGASLAAAVLILALPLTAKAQGWDVSLGAGVGVAPDYEGSDDYEAVPVLLARAQNGNRYIDLTGTTLSANLLGGPTFVAGPLLNYRKKRNNVDDNAVDDLDKVDAAIELGGFVGINYLGWLGKVSVSHDVNNAHDGFLVDLSAGYRAKLAPGWSWGGTVSTTYADSDYMDTYFSIDAGDSAASGLDQFDADKGFKDIGLNLNVAWGHDVGWGVTAIGSYTRLLDDAEDSPVVDDSGDENQLFGGLAVTYAF